MVWIVVESEGVKKKGGNVGGNMFFIFYLFLIKRFERVYVIKKLVFIGGFLFFMYFIEFVIDVKYVILIIMVD